MKKYKLWDSNNINYGLFDSMESAYKRIQQYTESHSIAVFYYRQNLLQDNLIYIDYGSYSHFFYIKEVEVDV